MRVPIDLRHQPTTVPRIKSNHSRNPNPTTKRSSKHSTKHSHMSYTHPEKFIRDNDCYRTVFNYFLLSFIPRLLHQNVYWSANIVFRHCFSYMYVLIIVCLSMVAV